MSLSVVLYLSCHTIERITQRKHWVRSNTDKNNLVITWIYLWVLINLLLFTYIYRISENTALIASLRAEINLYETNMTELQGLNQVLRDEHQALQMAFAAIEEKLRKAQVSTINLFNLSLSMWAQTAD